MKRSFLLARSNLRRAKGQTAAILALIFLAASMLNLWLMLSLDYRQNFDRCHDRLNAGHVTLVVDDVSQEMREFLAQTLAGDERTASYSLDDCMHMVGLFPYRGGEINMEMMIREKEEAFSCQVGRAEMIEDGAPGSGIYMPMLYRSEEIGIGKTLEISIGSRKMKYTVCGFFNSVMTGSHNCSVGELILTEDRYRELEESGYAPKALVCSVRLADKAESEDFETMLVHAVSSRFPGVRTVSNSYALVSQSRYISQMICSGVISAMAFFILLIALVVIASNITNYIQENMRSLGALKAIGYTGNQLVGSLLVQFGGLAFLAAAAGAGVSYGMFPLVNTMMISQTGIPYTLRFLPFPFFAAIAILCGAVVMVVILFSRRIRKTEPITALRQGILTHNFRRNHVPLDETRAPLNFALALKTTLSGMKQNLILCVTMLVLSLVVVFSGLMIRNMIVDLTPFLNLIVGETADSCINVRAEAEAAFLEEMEADRRVEKIYLYNSTEVQHVGGVGLMATISDDFARANNQSIVFEGRFPKYENEIAVAAKYAREEGLEIGHEMTVTAGGKEASYLITGFTQTSNNLGKDCLLTREGYERLAQLENVSYYLNLVEGCEIDAFHREVRGQFQAEINAMINVKATVEGAGSVYVSLMRALVAVILVLSVLVILFVLYLLVRTMLGKKKRDYGILKALGFTTGQLILQTALSFMPAVALSTAAGMTVSSLIINPLTALFLGSIGIVKCTFVVPVGFNVAAGAALVLSAFLIACFLSRKIRKISPRELLAGE